MTIVELSWFFFASRRLVCVGLEIDQGSAGVFCSGCAPSFCRACSLGLVLHATPGAVGGLMYLRVCLRRPALARVYRTFIERMH